MLSKKKGELKSDFKWFRNFVQGINPSVSFDQTGNPTFNLDNKNRDDVGLEKIDQAKERILDTQADYFAEILSKLSTYKK